jgi:hypothetical protein
LKNRSVVFACQGISGIEKQGLVMQMGKKCISAALLFEQSAHILDGLPVEKAVLSTIWAGLSFTPFFTTRYSWTWSFLEN